MMKRIGQIFWGISVVLILCTVFCPFTDKLICSITHPMLYAVALFSFVVGSVLINEFSCGVK